ncbi:MAG: hypothetical protein JXR26_07435 [Balneolaceae bacterium]|nr:hypothetical protein [Balneolaceae bacterium]
MFKKLYFWIILVTVLCIPIGAHGQSEYKYYFSNYHPKAIEFEAAGNIYTIKGGGVVTYTSDYEWKSIRVLSTNKTYRVEPGEGNLFYWHRRKKQIECRINSDDFYGYKKRIKATIANTTSQRVTVYWAGEREVLKPRYSKTISITSLFKQGLYIYQNGSVYAIPPGKHKMFWNDRLNKVSIDVNHYY